MTYLHRRLKGAQRALLLSAPLVWGAVPSLASTAPQQVALGEVTAPAVDGEADAALIQAFRRALERELARVTLERSAESYILSAALVRLEDRGQRRDEAACSVSGTLRTSRSGELRAVISGHAAAEASDASSRDARLRAMRAAVRGAVSRIPEALAAR